MISDDKIKLCSVQCFDAVCWVTFKGTYHYSEGHFSKDDCSEDHYSERLQGHRAGCGRTSCLTPYRNPNPNPNPNPKPSQYILVIGGQNNGLQNSDLRKSGLRKNECP